MEDVQEQQPTEPTDDEDQNMDEAGNYDDGNLQQLDTDIKQTSTEQAPPPHPSPVFEQKGPAQVPSSDAFVIQR
jgi:hypothetical protein